MIAYPDDILIYIQDERQGHVNAVWWVFEELRKHGLYANLKKCQFHKDKVRFLGYIVLAQKVQMEDKRIEVVRNWHKPKLMKDIQVFLDFAISTNVLSRALVRSLDHSFWCSK